MENVVLDMCEKCTISNDGVNNCWKKDEIKMDCDSKKSGKKVVKTKNKRLPFDIYMVSVRVCISTGGRGDSLGRLHQ